MTERPAPRFVIVQTDSGPRPGLATTDQLVRTDGRMGVWVVMADGRELNWPADAVRPVTPLDLR